MVSRHGIALRATLIIGAAFALSAAAACVGDDPVVAGNGSNSGSSGSSGDALPGSGPDGASRVCEPQSRVCDGNRLMKCSADGSARTLEQECTEGCDAAHAQCTGCTASARRCNGKRLEVCGADGRTFTLDKECSSGEACDGPGGVCLACTTAGGAVCVGKDSHLCSADRRTTTLKTTCGSVGCDGATGTCNTCNPAQTQCAATEFCDAPNCTTLGLCKLRPTTSSPAFGIACGCDGVTYWNKQHANFNGKTTKGAGQCLNGVAKVCNPTDGSGCGAGEYCTAHWGRVFDCGTGVPAFSICMNKPADFVCPVAADMNGGAACGSSGACINDCKRFAGFQSLSTEPCGG